jgi:FKBP-type peptidyl-prolyl cis-trans isomerase FkpA
MRTIKFILPLAFLFLCIQSCKKEDFDQLNEEEIETYLSSNGLSAQKTNSGLYYIIEKPGVGDNPNINSKVTVHYHGYYTDGTVFDSSVDRGETSEFPLKSVIEGWQEGIPLFKKGGVGTLIIPSRLAYGSNPPGNIRSNAVLVFEIQLFDFK